MKLNEIHFTDEEINDPGMEDYLRLLEPGNRLLRAINDDAFIGISGGKYTLTLHNQVVGYLSLGMRVRVGGKEYLPVNMIYVLEKYRNTKLNRLFLLGLMKVVKLPLIIGGKTEKGGTVTKKGGRLIQSFAKRWKDTVKVLDLNTETERELSDADFDHNNDDITFVLEGTENWPPLVWDNLTEANLHVFMWNDAHLQEEE